MDKLEFFQSIGFTEYESKVLVSLLKLKIATTKEIGLNSGVPQNKLYHILNKFEILGIVELIPERLKKYQLINIETIVDNRIK